MERLRLNQIKYTNTLLRTYCVHKRRKRTVMFNGVKESLISSLETEMFADRREEIERTMENLSEEAWFDHFIACGKIETFSNTDTLLLIINDCSCYQIKII